MIDTKIIQFYEKLVEHKEALWILSGRDPSRIGQDRKDLLQKEAELFLDDARHLPPAFRLMIAQCFHSLLKKYEIKQPRGLKMELDAEPLKNFLEDELSEWQILLRERILSI